jgi:hypothetical protein
MKWTSSESDRPWKPAGSGAAPATLNGLAQGKKRSDTVGEPPNAENYASHMPSLKAQEQGESEVATAALSRGDRFANSIRSFVIRPSGGASRPRTLSLIA